MKNVNFLLHLAILFSVFFFTESRSIKIPWPQQSHRPFKPKNNTENAGSCSYSVSITTSCSSPRYTRDQISLAFGDAYGNQVYAPRIDNPSARAFESCSTDTFEILGPCTYQVCYVYLYRNGYDGWKTQTITIYGHYTKSVTFYYNSFIPNGVWYGFNQCNSASESSGSSSM